MPGKIQNPITVLLLSFVTCGLYAIYWYYLIGTELKIYLGKSDDELNPIMNLVLGILCCPYGIYLFYFKYPKEFLVEAQRKAGIQENDISMMTLLFAFVCGYVSLYLIQTELNKVWEAAGAQPA